MSLLKVYSENDQTVVEQDGRIHLISVDANFDDDVQVVLTNCRKPTQTFTAKYDEVVDVNDDSVGTTKEEIQTYLSSFTGNFKVAPGGNGAIIGNNELIYSNSLKIGDITAGDILAGSTGGVNAFGANITSEGIQILNTAAPKTSPGGVYPSTSQITFVKLLSLGKTSLNRFRVKYKVVFGGTINTNHRYVGFGQMGEGVKTPINGGWLTCGSTGKSRTFEYFNESQTVFTNDVTAVTVLEIDAYQWDKQCMIISKINGVVQPLYKGATSMETDAKGRTPGHWAFYALGGNIEKVYDLEIYDLSSTCDTLFVSNSILDQWGLAAASGQWNVVNQLQQHTQGYLDNVSRSSSIARDFIGAAAEIARKPRKRVVLAFGANEFGNNLVTPAQAAIDFENLVNAILAIKPNLEIVVWLMPCAFGFSAEAFNNTITTWANGRGFEVVPVWQAMQAAANSTTMFPNYVNDITTHWGFIGHNSVANFVVSNYIHTIQ